LQTVAAITVCNKPIFGCNMCLDVLMRSLMFLVIVNINSNYHFDHFWGCLTRNKVLSLTFFCFLQYYTVGFFLNNGR